MNLDPAPRLPKWIFLAIDAGLLLTAFIIAYFAKNPYAPLPFISAVLFVGAAAIVGLIPFLVDYAADSAEYIQQERERVDEQIQRLQAAGESLVRTTAQIKAVEEAVHKTAHAAENLPYRMQEKLAEFNQQLAQTEDEEKERMTEELATLRQSESERLQAIAGKIHQATADWAALETATRRHLGAAQDAAAKLEEKYKTAIAQLNARLGEQGQAATGASHSATPPAPEPPPAVETPARPTVGPDETAPGTEEPKPKKNRTVRKSRPEETLVAMSEPSAMAEGGSHEPGSPGESMEASSSAMPTEASASSDGATRLLATAYIGIGNKLFIRGDGPGLAWDKGAPMQFVSIGKWGWATHDASSPVRCKLFKNDETAALSGEVVLDPGKHVEITALF